MRHEDHSGKRDALIKIMHATYESVRAIEHAHGLSVGDNDFRPRIEYFHDAVRVLSHRPQDMYLPRTRLSVEHLAYDMSCLRYIQERPLVKLNPGAPSPKTRTPPEGLLQLPPAPGVVNLPVQAPQPLSPYLKAELSEHYRTYTVLYAALFAETADINFTTRANENDTKVEDMAQIEQMIKMLEQGQMQLEQVEQAIEQVEDMALRTQLMAILHQRGQRKREKFALLQHTLRQWMWGVDMDTKAMDKAHMSFLSGQMVMYQESKDLIRKLSAQGMAMAGKFLEEALSQAAGRGQGQGR
jgi:exonuclease VII small subunit